MEYDFENLLPDFCVYSSHPYQECEELECKSFEYPSDNGEYVRFADYKMLMRVYLHKKLGGAISLTCDGEISLNSVTRYNFGIEHHGNEQRCLDKCTAETHSVGYRRLMSLNRETRMDKDFSDQYVDFKTYSTLLELYKKL